MVKTVRLRDETHQLLESLREKEEAKSYDQLIRRLITRSGALSGYRRDPDLSPWREEEDRARFHE
jgi:predicted CopG family antitoxin